MFSSIINESLNIETVLICTAVSLVLGLVIAVVYMISGDRYSKNFVTTLVVLPALVQVVIMMVNGNLGTSVAVLGAFGLVRFRSVAGSSREIASIFFVMAVGLATGMGYVAFAVLIVVIIALVFILLSKIKFGEAKSSEKELRITIPESLDYSSVFDDIFEKYTTKSNLEKVKTTNLGSMFELSYRINLKDVSKEKQMIDDIRCRNGNLTIICAKVQGLNEEL